jgi:hypothetical protein
MPQVRFGLRKPAGEMSAPRSINSLIAPFFPEAMLGRSRRQRTCLMVNAIVHVARADGPNHLLQSYHA